MIANQTSNSFLSRFLGVLGVLGGCFLPVPIEVRAEVGVELLIVWGEVIDEAATGGVAHLIASICRGSGCRIRRVPGRKVEEIEHAFEDFGGLLKELTALEDQEPARGEVLLPASDLVEVQSAGEVGVAVVREAVVGRVGDDFFLLAGEPLGFGVDRFFERERFLAAAELQLIVGERAADGIAEQQDNFRAGSVSAMRTAASG